MHGHIRVPEYRNRDTHQMRAALHAAELHSWTETDLPTDIRSLADDDRLCGIECSLRVYVGHSQGAFVENVPRWDR